MKTARVSIKKSGAKIILEPVADGWGWLDELRGQLMTMLLRLRSIALVLLM